MLRHHRWVAVVSMRRTVLAQENQVVDAVRPAEAGVVQGPSRQVVAAEEAALSHQVAVAAADP